MKNIIRLWTGIAYGLEFRLKDLGYSATTTFLPACKSREEVQENVLEIVRTIMLHCTEEDQWVRLTTQRFLENVENEYYDLVKHIPDYFQRSQDDVVRQLGYDYLKLTSSSHTGAKQSYFEHLELFQRIIRALIVQPQSYGIIFVQKA